MRNVDVIYIPLIHDMRFGDNEVSTIVVSNNYQQVIHELPTQIPQ